jgi:hypothetical protein
MRELQNAVMDEVSKIEQSYKSDYEIALWRENAIENSLAPGPACANPP